MLLFEAIVEGLPDAVVCVDGTDKIRYWNRAAEEFFGFDNTRQAANAFAEDAAVQAVVNEQRRSAPVSLVDSQWQQTSVLIQKQNGEYQSAIRLSRQISIEGEPTWLMVIFKNPSIEHFAEAELSRLALHRSAQRAIESSRFSSFPGIQFGPATRAGDHRRRFLQENQ